MANRFRSRRWAIVVAMVITMIGLLPAASWWLSHSDPLVDCADALVIGDMASELRAAAEFANADAGRKLWIVQPRPSRAVRMGAVRSFSERCRENLLERGVPDDRIQIVNCDSSVPHDWFRGLVTDPRIGDRDMLVFSDATFGRFWRNVIDQALPPRPALRFVVRSRWTASMRPTVWFRSRYAAKVVVSRWLGYLFGVVIGPSEPVANDRYESILADGALADG